MIANRKEFYSGMGMMAIFLIVLGLFFTPIYNGHNGLSYLDNLYNSISKGSANYLEIVNKTAISHFGQTVEVSLSANNTDQAKSMFALLHKAEISATISGEKTLTAKGDLGMILQAAAQDATDMYHNQGQIVSERRDMEERNVLYTWWNLLASLEKQLKKQKRFTEAKQVALIVSRGIEPAYNYYGVEAQSIMDRMAVVAFSLIFYVVYTLWYGFAILFMFEGSGFKLEH